MEADVRLGAPTRRLVAVAVGGLLGLLGGPPEAAAGDPPADVRGGLPRSADYDVTAVSLNVLVQDADGAPVVGLTSEDFGLAVDGERRTITTVEAFTESGGGGTSEVAEPGGEAVRSVREPVYVALLVDNRNLRTWDRNRMLRMLQDFVRSGFAHPVRLAVLALGERVEVVQPFTDEPAAVVEALRQLRSRKAGLDELDERREEIHAGIRRAQQNRHYSATSRRQIQNDLYHEILEFSRSQGTIVSETLAAMRQVFLSLTGLPGPTSVVYVSNGLPMALGAELMQRFTGLSTHNLQGSQTYSRNRHHLYDTTAAAANAQQITIYTVDATTTSGADLEVGEADSRLRAAAAAVDRTNRQAPLKLLADATGGVSVLDTEGPEGAVLAPIRTALMTFYSIVYDPGPADSDTVHRLEVTLPSRPDHRLHFSRTLVNKALESRVQDRVTAALFGQVGQNPLGIEVAAAPPAPATPDRWQAVVEVRLPVTSLRMVRQGPDYVGEAQHFVALLNLGSGVVETQRQAHTFRIPATEYDTRSADGFPIYLRLLVEEGPNRIVVGVIDRATLQTSVEGLQVTAGG